jgi:hypothetical protein
MSRRQASPAPDGPGAPPASDPPLGCARDPLCRVADPEHVGECDPRPERERARALHAHLDAGLDGTALAEAAARDSREAMARVAGRRN